MPKVIKISVSLLLALALLVPAAFAEYAAIGKTTDSLRLRQEPSLSAKILTTAPKGAAVTVTQKDPTVNKDGSWYPVIYNGSPGYMSADYLSISKDGEPVSEIGYINDNSVNFRTQPNTSCDKILVFSKNTKVEVTGTVNGWYAVTYDGKKGYVRCDLITLASEGYTPTPLSSPSPSVSSDYSKALSTLDSTGVTDLRRELVEFSFNSLGKPYRYGAAGPDSFDCSGFTTYVFKKFGITLYRSSADQYKNGTAVSKADLLPGDLVFFRTTSKSSITHVGLYIGGGDFIHASSGTGKCIKINTLNSGYYYERYVGARSVL